MLLASLVLVTGRWRSASAAVSGQSPVPVYLALAAGLGAGVLLGASAARRAGASCVRDLGSGDTVELHGLAGESSVQGVARRLTLFGVSIRPVGSAHRCSVSRLVVRLDTIPSPVRAGARVTVQGEWVRIGRPSAWPRRPGRRGIVVGRLDEPGGGEDRLLAPAAAAPTRVLRAARARASDRLRRLLPPDVSPVARALVLAERDDLPGSLRTRFAEAGLAHLLAISGLHVGLIGAAIGLLLRSFAGPRGAAVGAAAVVAVYVAAIGAPPSAVRASLLLAGWAVARIRGLPARAWDLLGVAALVALVKDPLVLVEPGFQLSFAGFSGLGAGAAVWQGCTGGRAGNGRRADGPLRRLPRGARE